MPDLRPQSALFRLTRTVLQTGLRPQDGEELQLAKNLLNLASALFAIATLLWLAACLGANSPLPVAGAAAVPLLAGLNLTLFARHGHVTLYARVLFGLMLAFPVVTQWLLGPVPAASGLPLWAALAPASALLCLGVAESTPWSSRASTCISSSRAAASTPRKSNAPFSFPPRNIARRR